MKKSILCFLMLFLTSCGYSLQNYEKSGSTLLGNGTATIGIGSVEHATMFTWVPYDVQVKTRNEVSLRKLGLWAEPDKADYIMEIRVPSFRVVALDSNAPSQALISAATIQIQYTIYDKNGALVWQSDLVTYSENYENPREENAIEEVLAGAIKRVFDKLQTNF